MNRRHLVSFSSPVPHPPSFVIPVFSVPGGNHACVQDLDAGSRIRCFVPFHTGIFTTVTSLPPMIERQEGDEGILAFWMKDGSVLVGTRAELKAELSSINEGSLPEFVAVEAMSLVGDQARLDSAARRASAKLTRAKAAYLIRVRDRSEVLKQLEEQEREAAQPCDGFGELERLLIELQKPLPERKWYQLWHRGWRDFGYSDRLYEIAKWRIENVESYSIENDVVFHILLDSFDQQKAEYAIRWLMDRADYVKDWHGVWRLLFNHGFELEHLIKLAVRYLQVDLHKRRSVDYRWMTTWERVWINSPNDRFELADIAHQALNFEPYPDYYVERVIMNLFRDPDHSWAFDYLRQWLSKPRSLTIWVDLYLENWSSLGSHEYTMTGVAWLKRFGRGMNVWLRLWQHVRQHIDPRLSTEIAESWLVEARKNLSKWPTVFAEVYDSGREASPRLSFAARLWVDDVGSRKTNALIEHVAASHVGDSEP